MPDSPRLPAAGDAPARLAFVDIAKGLMILAVVLSHAWYADSDLLGRWLPFSMPVFFFLSGYTHRPGRSWFQNVGRRAIALLVPYVCFCALCNCFFPVYAHLVKRISLQSYYFLPTKRALWLAVAKADALGMAMSTPMWFLPSLFTASLLFFALADWTRQRLWRTVLAAAVLTAAAIGIDVLKSGTLPWFIDLAPYAAAIMLIGAYCGQRRLFQRLTARGVILGALALAAAEVLNRVFYGSARTSIVQYIESGAWYGVLTALAIALTGCVGTLLVARLLQGVPVVGKVFAYLGRRSLWILCIHYCFIMLVELWLYTKGQLTNSILDVVSQQLYGIGDARDTPKDFLLKTAVALVSLGLGLVYSHLHDAVKQKLKAAPKPSP